MIDAELYDVMGNDLLVVNAARVSFDKVSHNFTERDSKLLAYLAKHKHELPFAHPHVTFRCKAPIFLARQLMKHQVGFVWSEVSRRYVTDDPEFWEMGEARERAPSVKQGSQPWGVEGWKGKAIKALATAHNALSLTLYKRLMAWGLAPELARTVLPQSAVTEWMWTGSLLAWARMYNLRTGEGAQAEAEDFALIVGAKMEKLFPVSWALLTTEQK